MKFNRIIVVLALAAVLFAGHAAAQTILPSGGASGAGVNYRAAYAGATAYAAGDIVTYQNATYLCTANSPAGTLPTDVTKWAKLGPTNETTDWETVFRLQTVAAPTGVTAVCDPGGVSGVTVNRYFQLSSFDASAAESLPSSEVSVLACPDDSTITVSWTPAAGAAGVGIYVGAATGAKSDIFQDLSEDPSAATVTFTILTGAGYPNLVDDVSGGAALPTSANARGLFYDFVSGYLYGSQGWFTDVYAFGTLRLGASGSAVNAKAGAPTGSCSQGAVYFRTDGAANTTAYVCTAANVWTVLLNDTGTWANVSYAGGNFTGGGAQTWTVQEADVITNRRIVTGKTMIWSVALYQTTVGGTANAELRLTLPDSATAATYSYLVTYATDNGNEVRGKCYTQPGVAYVSCNPAAGSWAAATNTTGLTFVFTIEIQ